MTTRRGPYDGPLTLGEWIALIVVGAIFIAAVVIPIWAATL